MILAVNLEKKYFKISINASACKVEEPTDTMLLKTSFIHDYCVIPTIYLLYIYIFFFYVVVTFL